MKKLVAVILLALSAVATAGDRYYQTDGGLITLKNEPCTLDFPGKEKHEYKTAVAVGNDGTVAPAGCWFFDEVPVNGVKTWSIAIYVPELDITFVYNPQVFTTTKPEVKGEI